MNQARRGALAALKEARSDNFGQGIYRFARHIAFRMLELNWLLIETLVFIKLGQRRRRVRRQSQVTVAFQIVHSSVWKLDHLYWLLHDADGFEPFILICPSDSSSADQVQKEYDLARQLCEARGYRYFESWQGANWARLGEVSMPKADVVFLQNSWERTHVHYKIKAWEASLVCYVPYFFTLNTLDRSNYGKTFHRRLWRYFLESNYHLHAAQKYFKGPGLKKLVVVGHPGVDRFLEGTSNRRLDGAYVLGNKRRARIIYAPHHTVSTADAGLAFSTFEAHALHLLEIARARKDDCFFTFKPHPLLYDKLLDHPLWGRARTDEYWGQWRGLQNGDVEEGDYVELFSASDAMIHDCNSFLAEYVATGNPVLFLQNEGSANLNDFGRILHAVHYIGQTRRDIEEFIDGVVISGKDSLRQERRQVVDNYLRHPSGKNASERVLRDLELSLRGPVKAGRFR